MNRALRWLLYILLGVVILVVIAGIVFAFIGPARYASMHEGIRMMAPYGYYRVGVVSPLRAIFAGLIGLGIFILVIVGIVALISALVGGSRQAANVQPVQPAAPVQAAPARTCSNCGKPLQDDWKTCPYCGTPIT